MVNINEIKKFEKEFMEQLILNKNKLIISGISTQNKENTKIDLTKLISCSENYYEDLIKIHTSQEKVIEINKDTSLDISGNGLIYMIINKNSKLNLNFNSKKFSAVFIKILINENITLEINENSNSKNLNKNILIIQQKNSTLNYTQIIKNSTLNITQSNLKEKAEYNLKSFYNIKNNNTYIKNIANNLEKSTIAKLTINGAARENSKVINDGLINIGQKAINSCGIQNMKNLILDRTSKIQSEPILEIKNSQVIASHSCSILQIEDEILFYMNSKGLNKEESINLYLNSLENFVSTNKL